MASTPCLDCLERRVGCHSTCASYTALKADNEAKRKYLERYKITDAFFKMCYLKRKKKIHYKKGL